MWPKILWIIKLGGSLLGEPELSHWLETVSRHGDGKVVIVPGGGIFADAVRDAQALSLCSDEVAHRMAVMSMDQYGVMLAGLNPSLVTAESELEIAERGWQHRAIVWLPSKMVMADDAIPKNWQVTSDSLAAWLANKLNAKHLLLVKSVRPQGNPVSIERLIKDGMVDESFADFSAGQNFNTWVVGKKDYSVFQTGLSDAELTKGAVEVRYAWN